MTRERGGERGMRRALVGRGAVPDGANGRRVSFFCARRSDFGRRASLRHLLRFEPPSQIVIDVTI